VIGHRLSPAQKMAPRRQALPDAMHEELLEVALEIFYRILRNNAVWQNVVQPHATERRPGKKVLRAYTARVEKMARVPTRGGGGAEGARTEGARRIEAKKTLEHFWADAKHASVNETQDGYITPSRQRRKKETKQSIFVRHM